MGSIGFPEIVVLFLLALILFGPKKLPEIGRILGRATREFRNATREFTSSVQQIGDDIDDEKESISR